MCIFFQIKVEPPVPMVTIPVLTNGITTPSKRRRSRSGSGSTGRKSVNVSLSSPIPHPVMSSSSSEIPTPEVSLLTKKEPPVAASVFKAPSPMKSPIEKVNSVEKKPRSRKPKKVQETTNNESVQPKIKKERKRKDKKAKDPVVEALSALPAAENDGASGVTSPNKKRKSKSPTKDKKLPSPLTTPSINPLTNNLVTPPIAKKSKATTPTTEKKQRKKPDGEPKKRKSRAKNPKIIIDGATTTLASSEAVILPIVTDVFAFGEVNKPEGIVVNGTPKAAPTKKKKSSSAAVSSTPIVGGLPEKEKLPPKKRKRVASTITSTPQALHNQCAIIDAVAFGTLAGDISDKNGIARSPDPSSGVIMQGVSCCFFSKIKVFNLPFQL